MRVLELYSGIGGMHYALRGKRILVIILLRKNNFIFIFAESTVEGSIVTSVDINTNANKVYKHNFADSVNLSRNIESFTIQEISKLNIDCILMSPPCQPFTRVGLKKDSSDNRCSSLLHVLQLIPQIKTLKYLLLENVKGFESSQARNEVVSTITNSDFNIKEFILSPCQFGIPNSRHRYYLIAKKKGLNFLFDNSDLITCLSEEILKLIPDKLKNNFLNNNNAPGSKCFKLKHILEENVEAKYLIPEKILLKHGAILDIRTAESEGSCCFTKAYTHYMEGTGSILSFHPVGEVKKKFESFNDSTESEKDRTKILLDLKLRYFTPKEISRLMCFPKDFQFPNDLSDKQKYRLLGNSINVFVVSQLIYLLHLEVSV